jgi:hypothetical protein
MSCIRVHDVVFSCWYLLSTLALAFVSLDRDGFLIAHSAKQLGQSPYGPRGVNIRWSLQGCGEQQWVIRKGFSVMFSGSSTGPGDAPDVCIPSDIYCVWPHFRGPGSSIPAEVLSRS